jgi:hypothetical protein
MIKFIKNLIFGKKEKIEPPDVRAYIKINDVAKESGVYDDENKIIEIYRYGKKDTIKYSEADVETLRENGIPVIDEEYSDEYKFFEAEGGGGIEYRR